MVVERSAVSDLGGRRVVFVKIGPEDFGVRERASNLLGKFGVIAFYVALITVIPASILVFVQLSVSWSEPGEIARLLGLLVRTLLSGAVWVAIPALTILTASSLADRARNAAMTRAVSSTESVVCVTTARRAGSRTAMRSASAAVSTR